MRRTAADGSPGPAVRDCHVAGVESGTQKHSEAEIARQAYAICESEGCPHGRDLDHWLRAEQQLSGSSGGGTAARRIARRPARAGRRTVDA